MATLNLSVPEELKSYIKAKALEMNSTVSEIFADYVKQIKELEDGEVEYDNLTTEQKEKIRIANELAGSIKVSDENLDIDNLRFNKITEKHLNDE